ncbi:hypothetical protein, partial [Parabacteroides distasonis]|uniref:hypothetical protein n=1 Tax=Parabacteroides distasonis TaxID=823 RepID=UPI001E4ADE08
KINIWSLLSNRALWRGALYTKDYILIKKYTIRLLGNHPLKRMARGTQPYFFNNSTHILCIKQA